MFGVTLIPGPSLTESSAQRMDGYQVTLNTAAVTAQVLTPTVGVKYDSISVHNGSGSYLRVAVGVTAGSTLTGNKTVLIAPGGAWAEGFDSDGNVIETVTFDAVQPASVAGVVQVDTLTAINGTVGVISVALVER